VFGANEPSLDAEMIAMLVTMLVRFGLDGGAIEVSVNSLGEPEEREAYRQKLVDYFSGHRDRLDDDSRRRLETNPLRILDSKNDDVIAVAAGAPKLIDELSEGLARFHASRCCALGVKHEVDPAGARARLLHGTIFEIKTNAGELARRTLAGGGRYDRLVASLGGQVHTAIGFALGIERALAIPDGAESYEPALGVFFAPMDGTALDYALDVRLRGKGIRVEIEHRPLQELIKRASKLRARAADHRWQRDRVRQADAQDLAHGTHRGRGRTSKQDPPAVHSSQAAIAAHRIRWEPGRQWGRVLHPAIHRPGSRAR
jgi:histidyl-tRNA synthetase